MRKLIRDYSHLNSNLLDFVIESFPIIKHISWKLPYSQKQISAKFGKCLWEMFVFFFKIFPGTKISMQMTFLYLCFLQKLGLKSFEWSHLLQFPKYCKNRTINSRPCLIPTNPKKYHYSLKILLHYEKSLSRKTCS